MLVRVWCLAVVGRRDVAAKRLGPDLRVMSSGLDSGGGIRTRDLAQSGAHWRRFATRASLTAKAGATGGSQTRFCGGISSPSHRLIDVRQIRRMMRHLRRLPASGRSQNEIKQRASPRAPDGVDRTLQRGRQ